MSCVTTVPPVLARDGKNGASDIATIGSTRGWLLERCRMPSPTAGFATAGAVEVFAAALRGSCAAGLPVAAAGVCAEACASIGLAAADGEHDWENKNAAPTSAAFTKYRAMLVPATRDAGRRDG